MGQKKKTTPQNQQIRILAAAYQDIEDATDYIAEINQQPLNAVKVADAMFETIDKIALNPFAYKECPYLPTKTKIYRQAVCLSWLIIYRITVTEILILGVIHSARRPSVMKALRKVK